ncbi:MAG: hypothetical protein AAFP76_04180 [Bacteroidota bacterium]
MKKNANHQAFLLQTQESLPDVGVEINQLEFQGLLTELMDAMNSNVTLDVNMASDMVKVWNTTLWRYLEGLELQFEAYDQLFTTNYLSDSIRLLEAIPDRGLRYYSKTRELAIGGLPDPNSCFRVGKPRKINGGVTGIKLDVTYTVPNFKDDCDSIQVIQVVWTYDPTRPKVGDKEVTSDGKKYYTFVDGGKNSPGGEVVNGKPYFLADPPDFAGKVTEKADGSAEVNIKDIPTAALVYDILYFETAIICVNYKKTGKDKVLHVFKWGFNNNGKTYETSPGSGKKNAGLETYNDVSQAFKDTLKHDYPNYELAP